MMKVLYLSLPDRVPETSSVWLRHGTHPSLLGFVRHSTDGWKSRTLSAPEVHGGFKVRSEATSFLAVERRFAPPRRRRVARAAGLALDPQRQQKKVKRLSNGGSVSTVPITQPTARSGCGSTGRYCNSSGQM
jgi:hypothetical protein